MKKLVIKSDNSCLNKGTFNISIDNKSIQDIITDNLPELEEYKNYSVKVNIEIEFLDKPLTISTEGYEVVPKQESKESGDKVE